MVEGKRELFPDRGRRRRGWRKAYGGVGVDSRAEVPQQNRPVPTPAPQVSAIRTERHARRHNLYALPTICNEPPVAASHSRAAPSRPPLASVPPSGLNATLMTSSVCPSIVRRCAPVAASHRRHRIVKTPACQRSAIRAERYASNIIRMSFKRSQVRPRCRVPQPHRFVGARACQRYAIRAERHAIGRIRMPSERSQWSSCHCIPASAPSRHDSRLREFCHPG